MIDLDKLRGHGASLAGSNNSSSIKSNESSSKKASTVLKDLLRFKDVPAANKLLCHPVVTTIIDIRYIHRPQITTSVITLQLVSKFPKNKVRSFLKTK